MSTKTALYAQSGGVTSVINASACGVIQGCRELHIPLYAGVNGIMGILHEELIDTTQLSDESLSALRCTPGGAFGSCRHKLGSLDNVAEYEQLFKIFEAHNVGYFFYNGGGDSQDTAHKIDTMGQKLGYPIHCIGIPKTIDNDLPFTDNCPGFGSVAKYVAISTLEASLDLRSMSQSSTKVFILEVMGRHAGFIAAASGLAFNLDDPHMILMPERSFNPENFCETVKSHVTHKGYCTIVASEGIKTQADEFVSASKNTDAFGHAQLGGVAPKIAELIKKELAFKCHWGVSDYLQRSARHIAAKVDCEQAFTLGRTAVYQAHQGKSGFMLTLVRTSDDPYRWECGEIELHKVANQEKKVPKNYITADGYQITEECRRYLEPLILGEDYPLYLRGLPCYVTPTFQRVPKKVTV